MVISVVLHGCEGEHEYQNKQDEQEVVDIANESQYFFR